jgi:hypothetical protein
MMLLLLMNLLPEFFCQVGRPLLALLARHEVRSPLAAMVNFFVTYGSFISATSIDIR